MFVVPAHVPTHLLSNGTWTLKTLVQTRETINNYALTTKINQPSKKKLDFEAISGNQEFMVFLCVYNGFELLTTKTIVETKKKHQKP